MYIRVFHEHLFECYMTWCQNFDKNVWKFHFVIETCWEYNVTINDLILLVMYVEHMVLFD